MKSIKNRLGFSFAVPIRAFCGFITLMSVGGLFSEPILGIIGIIISAFFWSSLYGIEINPADNKFREFSSAYGIKRGKWKILDRVPFISIMPIREAMSFYSQSNRRVVSQDDKLGVYLLTNSHRTKILVQKFDDVNEAKKYAETVSQTLKKEIVQYNPVVSEKTRRRRSR